MSKIPATVITGFLGAGKSTLIRSLLTQADGRKIALIINEFGDVGVDGDLIKACGSDACGEEDIVELANGCICCTVADEFIPTMTALLERDQRPDHIVIETSGLALPQPLVKAFNWPDIRSEVTVDGVITVVDGAAVHDGLFAADPAAVQAQREADASLDHESPLTELFEDQLNCADLILLNKADLLDAAAQQSVRALIERELHRPASIVTVENGNISPAILLGVGAAAEADLDTRLSHHERDHGHEDHDHDDFFSFVVPLPDALGKDDLTGTVAQLMAMPFVLRIKGFAVIEGADGRFVVQAVGRRVEGYFDRQWGSDEARRGALVVIGEKAMDEAAIRQAIGQLAPATIAAE